MHIVELILANKTIFVEVFHFIEVSCLRWALDIILEFSAEEKCIFFEVK